MEYHPIPQPHEISDREKEDAMGAYLMMFASAAIGLPLPIINLIAAIVYYYINKGKGRFVAFNTLQSLYSQLPISCFNIALVAWAVTNWIKDIEFTRMFWGYLIMVGIVNLTYLIFSLIGAAKSYKGRFFYFLFFGKLAFHQVYKIRSNENGGYVNKAPNM